MTRYNSPTRVLPVAVLSFFPLMLQLVFAASPYVQAQQRVGSKGNTTTAAGKPPSAAKSLTLIEGPWSGMNGEFTFSVKRNALAGDAKVPVFFNCSTPREIHSVGGITLHGAMGAESISGHSIENFSKIAQLTGSHSFVATFSVKLSNVYTVVVRGKFSSPSTATGTITVRSSACKDSNSITWDAAPVPHASPVAELAAAIEPSERDWDSWPRWPRAESFEGYLKKYPQSKHSAMAAAMVTHFRWSWLEQEEWRKPKKLPPPHLDKEDTWTDPATGLMWSRSDNGRDITWDEAVRYCSDSRLGGYSEWRIPGFYELKGIYHVTSRRPLDVGFSTAQEKDGDYVHIKGNIHITGSEWSNKQEGGVFHWFSFTNPNHYSTTSPPTLSAGRRTLCVRMAPSTGVDDAFEAEQKPE